MPVLSAAVLAAVQEFMHRSDQIFWDFGGHENHLGPGYAGCITAEEGGFKPPVKARQGFWASAQANVMLERFVSGPEL
jgi:hypothetical protein